MLVILSQSLDRIRHSMKRRDAQPQKPTVPVVYWLFVLALAAERGVRREALLAGTGVGAELLERLDARTTPAQYGRLCGNALRLTGDKGLGYEIGLRSQITKHGFLGYGLMSCATLREGLELVRRYLRARIPFFSVRLKTDGRHAVVELGEALALGRLRRFGIDAMLVELGTLLGSLLSGPVPELELWFDYPEPDYYPRYRRRLPTLRFAREANQLRFPAALLDRRLATANPVTARLMIQECERELALLGHGQDLLGQVRALLVMQPGGYPDVSALCAQLHLSSRSLKRKLRQQGTSFMELRDQARRRDGQRLLESRTLPIEEISARLGYSDPANFTRAFRRWTGESPSASRARSAR